MSYTLFFVKDYQQIDEGGRIYILGEVDKMVFDENELAASVITILLEVK